MKPTGTLACFTGVLLVIIALCSLTQAGLLYDKCSSTLSCEDPGLTCHEGRCVCIYDKGKDALEFWGCDDIRDCEGVIRLAADQLSYSGHRLASEMLNVEEPRCVPSEICPNPRGLLECGVRSGFAVAEKRTFLNSLGGILLSIMPTALD